MNYNFSKIKEQNQRLEEELQLLKKEYQKPQMPKEQFEKLQLKMKEAGMENQNTQKNTGTENRNEDNNASTENRIGHNWAETEHSYKHNLAGTGHSNKHNLAGTGHDNKHNWTETGHRTKHNRTAMAKFAAAAALAAVFFALPNTSSAAAHAMGQIPVIGRLIEAVTFRDYKYVSDKNVADIKVPELNVKDAKDGNENLKHSANEINKEIQAITDKLVKEFEANLANEGGRQDMAVDSEVLATTSDYFTLKLNCYQAAGSGYEWNYYYTIDLNTGERLQLKDLFKESADYLTPISENIKKQMREQMDADENAIYWLDSETEEWNFQSITDQTSFYLNEKDHVVIGFNEGDVAPMYMGSVEFEIPAEVLKQIRK